MTMQLFVQLLAITVLLNYKFYKRPSAQLGIELGPVNGCDKMLHEKLHGGFEE